ncbi:MAG: hypothetical protein KBF33_13640 [Comamonas sp.]|nr:hypothetical protein [Comamonas sp.]
MAIHARLVRAFFMAVALAWVLAGRATGHDSSRCSWGGDLRGMSDGDASMSKKILNIQIQSLIAESTYLF